MSGVIGGHNHRPWSPVVRSLTTSLCFLSLSSRLQVVPKSYWLRRHIHRCNSTPPSILSANDVASPDGIDVQIILARIVPFGRITVCPICSACAKHSVANAPVHPMLRLRHARGGESVVTGTNAENESNSSSLLAIYLLLGNRSVAYSVTGIASVIRL